MIKYFQCFNKVEDQFDKISYLETLGLTILLIWNLYMILRPAKDAADGGDRLGSSERGVCCCRTMKNRHRQEDCEQADENAVYTSDSRGSDEAGEGTYEKPFKTVMKGVKHVGKEPFPPIYVDVKPDSDAAKRGAKYELIAKAQLKKVTKLWQQEINVRNLAARAALSRVSPAGQAAEELRRELAAANNRITELQQERERRDYVDKIRKALASDQGGDWIILEGQLVDLFSEKKTKHGVVRMSDFPAMMNKLLATPKKHGLSVPEPSQYKTMLRRYDQSGYGRLTIDEWMKLASEEVFKKFL